MNNNYREGRPILLIKCMERKYIDSMLKYGQMRFSCPAKWVEAEFIDGIGQGDKYEGTFSIDVNNDREKVYLKKYGNNLIINHESNHTYYQLKTTIRCPSFCFYSVEDRHMQSEVEITSPGEYDVFFDIDGRFFTDFSHNMSVEEVNNLPEEERPALLIIMGYSNIEKFIGRVRKALLNQHGFCKSNILINQIEYSYDRTGMKDFNVSSNHPYELFVKGTEFEYQREARIILNSKKQRALKDDSAYIDIAIGNLEDIAQVQYQYIPEGYQVTMHCIIDRMDTLVERDGVQYEGYSDL